MPSCPKDSDQDLSHEPTTEKKEPPAPTVPPAGSGDNAPDGAVATAAAAAPEDGGRRVFLEGTMYDDGTYWKILICNWNLPFC